MGGDRSRQGSALRFSIDLPHLKLNLDAQEESLPEVRRIIEALGADETISEDAFYELRARLSEEFLQHDVLAARLKSALLLDEDVRIVKRILPVAQEYDLETGKQARQVTSLNVKEAVLHLFNDLQGTLRECYVHLRGEVDREQEVLILDAIKQRLGMDVKTRFFSTKKNLEGNILLEAVCFGEGLVEAW